MAPGCRGGRFGSAGGGAWFWATWLLAAMGFLKLGPAAETCSVDAVLADYSLGGFAVLYLLPV